jgi:hypothetical protein
MLSAVRAVEVADAVETIYGLRCGGGDGAASSFLKLIDAFSVRDLLSTQYAYDK